MGHELIPDVLDKPPLYPLELTYKTIRTYPGMKLTADLTRFKPMLHWPANRNSIYTVVMSNLDINNRKNRYVHKYKYIIKKIMQTNIFGWGPGNHVISHLEITKITEIYFNLGKCTNVCNRAIPSRQMPNLNTTCVCVCIDRNEVNN